ncbi:hypothetical protein BDZ94DRAFT_1306745 [Collybia nuda]|uniref:Uncharacterized protein n=1 Tax=Collybia nuda TaxID=64659 RepID=A0A9P5YBK7_9AGAR|nr:hypothetical protein BDZ94DRAFT_1306745 [Collybia nuda]
MSVSGSKGKELPIRKSAQGKNEHKSNSLSTPSRKVSLESATTNPNSYSPIKTTNPRTPRNIAPNAVETTPRRTTTQKSPTPKSKAPESPVSPARRSLIPISHSLHTKIILTRLLPPEITLQILSIAAMHRRTTFTRIRRPTSYRERQVHTPQRIYQLVPPTLHLQSPISSVSGVGTHPLRRVKIYIRFCPAKLPNALVWFEARIMRGGKPLVGVSVPLVSAIPMNGKLQSKMVEVGDKMDLVRMAEPGDRIGVWVHGNGGLYGDWLHIPGHEMRVLVEVREVSIECFCEW